MQIVHAAWGNDRRLHLWAEDAGLAGAASAGRDLDARARAAHRAAGPAAAAATGPARAVAVAGTRSAHAGGAAAARSHPFAARLFHVPVADDDPWPIEATGPGIELVLPTRGAMPLPSLGLPVDQGESNEPLRQAPWVVPSAAHDGRGACRILLALPASATPGAGASLRFFARAALLAVELVARGRFLPAPGEGSVGGRWRPAPGAGDVGRLAALASAMPGACLAARPDCIERADGAASVLDEFMTEIVDALVGEAAAAVELPRGAPEPVRVLVGGISRAGGAGPRRIAGALLRWANAVRPAEGPFRTLFRLSEPPPPAVQPDIDGESVPTAGGPGATDWRLEILVGARDDPSVVVPAADVWADPGPLRDVGGADPEEALLVDLVRAGRLYAPLGAALQRAVPDGVELDPAGAHAFLREGAPLLADAGYTVLLPSWWLQRRRRLGLRLHARVRPASGGNAAGGGLGAAALVDYDWRVAIGDAELTREELTALARLKSGLVLVRGQWVEVDTFELTSALRALEQPRPGHPAAAGFTVTDVFRTALGMLPAPGGLEVTGVEADGWLGAILSGDGTARPEPVPTPPGFAGTLRPYQERGLGWLSFLDRLGFGGILADDMGLGKTPQLLALLVAEQANVPPQERLGPTLVVCPMSVVGNWHHEAARFAPGLAVHVHHGAGRLAAADLAAAVRDVDMVVTTYGLLARDRASLSAIPWRRVVLDEAQEIKNSGTDQSRAARELRAPSRIALTGTPVENRLTELWTIMEFANPGFLGSEDAFRNRFSTPIERWRDEDAAERLRRLTAPFILRREKSDRSIVPDLPDKLEFGVSCSLTREQASLYQAVVDELMPDLEGTTEEQEYRGKVLRAILRLKQVCDHPALFLGDGSPLRGRSGKLERLEEILDQVMSAGERALVFTQFTEWADRLVPYLRDRFGTDVLYLHGGTPRRARDAMVARFESGSVPVFVLSLKAGGKGLNLVAANHVLHYDRWWNPAVEDQASDRAYRIGQTRDVQVRTFVATGTLEEKIADMLTAKRDLASRIIRAGERAFTELSTAELRALLSLGADAVAEG